MELPYFTIGIFLVLALIVVRAMVRGRVSGAWKIVFETNARGDGLALKVREKLDEGKVRNRLVYKGPPHSPIIGMSGEQYVAVEVRLEDLGKARPIVSRVLHEDWRGRF